MTSDDLSQGHPRRLWPCLEPDKPIPKAQQIPVHSYLRVRGTFKFVITRERRLVIGMSSHPSLVGSTAPVLAAGRCILSSPGCVAELSNVSGHYQCVGGLIRELVEAVFKEHGFENAEGSFRSRVGFDSQPDRV